MTLVGQSATRAIGLRLAAYAGVTGLSLITTGFVLRYLGADGAGYYFSGIAIALVTFSVSDQNIASVALRDAAVTEDGSSKQTAALREVLGFRLVSFSLASIPMAALLYSVGIAPFARSYALILMWIYLLITVSSLQIPAQSSMRQARASALLLVQSAATLLVAFSIARFALEPYLVFGAQIPGLCISTVVLLADRKARAVIRPTFAPRAVLAIVRRNAVLGAATGLAVISNRLSPVLISAVGGNSAAGQFGAAFRLADAIESLAPLVISVLLPVLAQSNAQSTAALSVRLWKLSWCVLPVGVAAGGIFATVGGSALAFLGGAEFEDLDGTCQALGCFIILAFAVQPMNYVLLAASRYRSLLAAAFAAAIVLLVLTPVLTASHGAAGGASALALSFLSFLLVSWRACLSLVQDRRWHTLLLAQLGLTGLVLAAAQLASQPAALALCVAVAILAAVASRVALKETSTSSG